MTAQIIINKCKDIPDKPILEFLLNNKGNWCNWHFEDEKDVRNAMPTNLASEKLILAKMKQLIKRGLVDGCACGCRGDFEITSKGEEWLLLENNKWQLERQHFLTSKQTNMITKKLFPNFQLIVGEKSADLFNTDI